MKRHKNQNNLDMKNKTNEVDMDQYDEPFNLL